MSEGPSNQLRWSWWGSWVLGILLTGLAVFLMIALVGVFHPKVQPELKSRPTREPVAGQRAAVRMIAIPRVESAVGSIRAVHETSVASKILAKVMEVRVAAGQPVSEGEVLIRLADDDLRARLRQTEAAIDAAKATRDQAEREVLRVEVLTAQASASEIELSRVQSALEAAQAELERAEHAAAEARTNLEYATISAPMSGTIIDKRVEVGDTASPGQVLVTLFDPTRMQLVAGVRESLTRRLSVGQTIGVQIDAIGRVCEGRVSEIVPSAEAKSRTFDVKVTGPCPPGVYAGMFGRVLIPLEDEKILSIPVEAVRTVGQLQLVEVVEGEHLMRRTVQLGRTIGGDVEVLSGLSEGDLVSVRGTSDAAEGYAGQGARDSR